MRRIHRIVFLAVFALALPALSGCADFDPDKLDVFGLNEKKKLPGDRKAVFPEGVPGVSQGVPQEYIKGNQPPPETAQVIPPEPEKPAVKPKKTAAVDAGDRPKRKPKPRTTTAAPSQPVQSAPDPAFDRPAPAAQQTAPWPSAAPAPAPGTFSR